MNRNDRCRHLGSDSSEGCGQCEAIDTLAGAHITNNMMNAMGRHLFTVEDTFAIRERGTILLPGSYPEGDESWRIGDPLILRRPDGTILRTTVRGMELHYHPGQKNQIPVLVPDVKSDVPIGTEVWSDSADVEPVSSGN